MPAIIGIAQLVGRIIGGFFRAAPLWLLVGLGVVLFYEGIPPLPISVPLIGEISLIDGRVDRVRDAADERCRQQKIASQRLAKQADDIRSKESAQAHTRQVEAANERTQAAEKVAQDYLLSVLELDESLQECRKSTPADDALIRR